MTSSPQVAPPAGVEERVPFTRLTTVGIGGPARWFARPSTLDELMALLEWAAHTDVAVLPLGLGSNVLAADAGVDALVVRLAGQLAEVDVAGERLSAGGGAANAVCLHKARRAGLGGMEFACAIPGTAGGGVRMNAGAYGRDWRSILDRALVVGAGGGEWRTVDQLGLSYRHSTLERGEVVAAVEFSLTARPPGEIKHAVRDLNLRRKASQPTNRRTFGSVFKNPGHALGAGQMLDGCGLKGFTIGRARISPRHANFIENVGGATAADAVSLMAEARRRALETYGVILEREVELLGGIELPPAGDVPER